LKRVDEAHFLIETSFHSKILDSVGAWRRVSLVLLQEDGAVAGTANEQFQ
jgi:hypothetical protein